MSSYYFIPVSLNDKESLVISLNKIVAEPILQLERLQNKYGKDPSGKSQVYRITFSHNPKDKIIAKYTFWENIKFEEKIYKQILPKIKINSLKCFGVNQCDLGKGWIFLQEAMGEPFSDFEITHQTIACNWLGKMHTETSKINLTNLLPNHGFARYFVCLQKTIDSIHENYSNLNFTEHHKKLLENVVSVFMELKSKWENIKILASDYPTCLVHGDFVGKNVIINGLSSEIFVLDWDISGLGPSCVDVELLNVELYWKEVSKVWSHLSLHDIHNMKHIGIILRNIGLIEANTYGLGYEYPHNILSEIESYLKPLKKSIKTLSL